MAFLSSLASKLPSIATGVKALTNPLGASLDAVNTISNLKKKPASPVSQTPKAISGTPIAKPITAVERAMPGLAIPGVVPKAPTTPFSSAASSSATTPKPASVINSLKAPSASTSSIPFAGPASNAGITSRYDLPPSVTINPLDKVGIATQNQAPLRTQDFPTSMPIKTEFTMPAKTASTFGLATYSPSSDIQNYRKQVLDALRPSADEQSLRDELAQFRGDAAQGIAGLEGQGRGIPLGIVRGQQEQLQRQANLQEQTLLDRLAVESADRQAALQAAQTQLGYSQLDQQAQKDALAAQEAQLKPFVVDGHLLQIDPSTGEVRDLYSSPKSSSAEGFTLGEGQLRFDSQGNLIASGLPKDTSSDIPTSIQEYEYAVKNGYTGSFNDYQNQHGANLPTSIEEYQYAVSQGYNGSFTDYQQQKSGAPSVPVSVGQDLANIQTIIQTIGDIDTSGGIPGVGATQNIPSFLLSDKGRNVRNNIAIVKAFIAKLNAGTSFTENEQKLLEQYVPKDTDFDWEVKSKLQNLNKFLSRKTENLQAQFGVSAQSSGSTQGDNSGASGIWGFNKAAGQALNSPVIIPASSRLAYVNNNPGNLRFANQVGAVQGDGGFARFQTPQAGFNALINQIGLDASRGHTLASFIGKYAPFSENKTSQYVSQVSSWLGAPPNTPLAQIDPFLLGKLIAKKESSTYIA